MAVFEALSTTVAISVYVPIPLAATGWTWGLLPGGDPAGHDYALNAAEVAAVLRVWSTVVARTLIHVSHARFAVAARSAATGAVVGRMQWARSSETGILRPLGQPLVVVPTLAACDTPRDTQRARARTY